MRASDSSGWQHQMTTRLHEHRQRRRRLPELALMEVEKGSESSAKVPPSFLWLPAVPQHCQSPALISQNSLKQAVTHNQHALKTLLEKMLLAQTPPLLNLFLFEEFLMHNVLVQPSS